MAHIADTLTEVGHNVTFLVPVADGTTKNHLGVKFTKDVVIVERNQIQTQSKQSTGTVEKNSASNWIVTMTSRDVEEKYSWFSEMMSEACVDFLRRQDIFEEMKARNFDVAITECVTVCGLGFFKKLGIEKTIITSSVSLYEYTLGPIGKPEDFSYVPVMGTMYSDRMNILQRYENYQMGHAFSRSVYRHFDNETQIYRQLLGNDLPDWRELFPAASLYFTNSIPYLDFSRPVIQKTIPIGGISVDLEHIKSQKLSEEWNEVLDRRSKTVLISFGSMVKSTGMPEKWRQNIFNAIKSFPDVTFIWKYESDDTDWASDANNIYFSKWVPQSALLADSRISAFMTHCGLGSINELAYCGKPAIMIPLFGDQMRNAFMLERHNTSVHILKNDLDKPEVAKNAIREILYDESYKMNAEKLANLLENQPFKAKELVVKHTEFVAQFGPFPQMDPYSRQLNYFQKNFFDIHAIIGFAYISITVFVVFCLVRIFKFLKKHQNLKKFD